jgi:hypothetical protein
MVYRFFGASRRETIELALSGTTAYLSNAERSRVERQRVSSVGADDEKREQLSHGEFVCRNVDRNSVRHIGRPPNPCCRGQQDISAGLSGLVRRNNGCVS